VLSFEASDVQLREGSRCGNVDPSPRKSDLGPRSPRRPPGRRSAREISRRDQRAGTLAGIRRRPPPGHLPRLRHSKRIDPDDFDRVWSTGQKTRFSTDAPETIV
jgi:hypothetical protein